MPAAGGGTKMRLNRASELDSGRTSWMVPVRALGFDQFQHSPPRVPVAMARSLIDDRSG
jgi:hypothetical protein